MPINQKSESLFQDICLIKHMKSRYVSYTAKSVYSRKYEIHDPEKARNLYDDYPQQVKHTNGNKYKGTLKSTVLS